MCVSANLQREEKCLPLSAPEVREDACGCDGENQRHHDASLRTVRGQQTQKGLLEL